MSNEYSGEWPRQRTGFEGVGLDVERGNYMEGVKYEKWLARISV